MDLESISTSRQDYRMWPSNIVRNNNGEDKSRSPYRYRSCTRGIFWWYAGSINQQTVALRKSLMLLFATAASEIYVIKRLNKDLTNVTHNNI